MKKDIVIWALSAASMLLTTSILADIIWSENFEAYSAGTGIDGNGNSGDYPAGVSKWTLDTSGAELSASTDYIKTVDGKMEARDTDGPVILTTESVSIAGYTNVQISVDITEESQLESADYADFEYRIDSGTWTLVTNWNGCGTESHTLVGDKPDDNDWESETVTVNSLTGTTLELRYTMKNNADTEYIQIDNMIIKEISGSEIPSPELDITSPEYGLKVANGVSSITVSGTCANCVGRLDWSNSVSGTAGSIAVTSEWSIEGLQLMPTNNVIVITGTNIAGEAVSDEIIIYCELDLAIAFTAFNADRDAFAFVALTEIAGDTDIIFTDEEWQGTDFITETGENDLIWNSGGGIDAGRVVVIDYCDNSANWSANYGSILSSSDTLGINVSDEDIYVYLGSRREPTYFLTIISTGNGEISGTGLEYGTDAVCIPSTLERGAEYIGPHSGFDTYMEYLTLLCAPSNWTALSSVPDSAMFIVNGGPLIPMLSIESPEKGSFYEYSTSGIMLSGSAANVTGFISWSNETSELSGEIAITDNWVIATVGLVEGAENLITVTATNSAGESAFDGIAVSRAHNFSIESAGCIAFTSFNSETDSFSFVVLDKIDAGREIRFTDEEWDGLKFGSNEDDIIWSNTVATAAGTVIAVKDCDDTDEGINATTGFVDGKLSLSQSGEDIYAYTGDTEREPTAFLTMISTATGELRGTGLIFGQTAVDIEQTPKSQYYSGMREDEKLWNYYLELINDPANWSDTEGVTESWGDETAFSIRKTGVVILVE